MKKTKLFLLLIIVLVVGVILSYLFYNNSSKDKISSEEAIDRVVDNIIIHEPPVRIEQGEVLGIKNEKKEWLILADSISIAEDARKTLIEILKKDNIYKMKSHI